MKIKSNNKIYDLPYIGSWKQENTVFLRGRIKEKVLLLPEDWVDQVDLTSLTVHLTQVGADQKLIIKRIQGREIHLQTNGLPVDAYFTVYGELLDSAMLD